MTRPLSLAAVLLCISAGTSLAQQGTSEIRGQVVDQQGAALVGVMVVVRHQDTGMFRETTSTDDGTYFVSGITPGPYEVSAELSGFKKSLQQNVRLEIGKTTTLNVVLEVGSLEEAVTVAADPPLVDVTSKEVGGNITSHELVSLPSINRNFIGFVGLLPGIVPNISTESFGSDAVVVNGQDPRNNNYQLDGANNNDDVIGQRAGTQARTPIESIQEFQVITNQFDAEFGRSQGAVINAVTKQGTNEFHGSAFVYVQDASLTAKDFFAKQNDLAKPDTMQNQFGGTVGGPILRNKAHFFFSLERVLIDEGITINIPARPEFNTTTTEKTRVWNTVVRGDHQLGRNHTWGVRWLRENSPQFNQLIPPIVNTAPIVNNVSLAPTLAAVREEDDLDQTVVGSLSSVFGNTRVNTLRLAWTQEDVAFANPAFNANGRQQDLLLPALFFQTFTDQQSAVAQSRINNAYQIEDTFAWFIPGKRGDHDIKVGAQYQRSTNDFNSQDNWNGIFYFSTNNAFDPANPRTYPERLQIRVPGPLAYYMKADYFSAFAQDKWKVTNQLTVSAGLRYDLERIPLDEVDNPAFGSPDDYPVDTNNIAPRLGFAYDMGGRAVLRGGYGFFYDKTHYELITGIITSGVFANSFNALFPANSADPGPSNGRLPDSAFLVNGPVVDRELLAQTFPPGSRIRNTGTVVLDSPDRRIPHNQQISIGYERQLWPTVSLAADYVHVMGRDQFMVFDQNPGVRDTPARTATIRRVDPAFVGQVSTPVNTGETDYDALLVQAEKRFSAGYSLRASYTLSHARGNNGGNPTLLSPFQFLDDMRLDLNEGPTDFDRRHNFVLSGVTRIPKTGGLTVSYVMRALSGLPLTLTDSTTDPDLNGQFTEPLPSGTYTGTGANAFEVDFESKRNGGWGPGFFQLDTRFQYDLRLPGQKVAQIYVDVFNLTNRANFTNPASDRRLTNFLTLAALRDGAVPRTLQLGARFQF